MAGWIEQRGKNKWRLSVPGGTDQDGKRIVFRRTIEATSKREAQKALNLFAAEVATNQYVEPAKMTFKEFADRWLRDYAEVNLAPKTVYRYKELLEKRIIPALGAFKLHQIKPAHIVEFYAKLQQGPRLDGREGSLSERTILHHHRLLSAMLNCAVQWQMITYNPASKVRPPKAKKYQAVCGYDRRQVAALLAALEAEPLKYRVMVVLALATGLRRGEIMALEWSDIDLQAGTLDVKSAAQYIPGKGQFVKSPKTEESQRTVSLPGSVVQLLKEYRKHQAEERLKVGDLWQGSNRLFTTWDGRPMHPDSISGWFREFIKRHSLPRLTFHGLRHLHATLLITSGVNIKAISARLGHSNTSTTLNIYAHALKSADREAAEKIAGFFHQEKAQK